MKVLANQPAAQSRPCLTRRSFLVKSAAGAGGVVGAVLLRDLFGPSVSAQDADREALLERYPERRIGLLSELELDQPRTFLYPNLDAHAACFVVRLGTPAGGGVGPGQDVVAFSSYCPHQGGLLAGNYDRQHKVMGPCPMHLSAFDLRRHGILTAGQATDNLPQVVLEARGDELWAIGVLGLIYGYAANVT